MPIQIETNLEVSELSGTHVGRGAKRTSLDESDITSRALRLTCCALEVVAQLAWCRDFDVLSGQLALLLALWQFARWRRV